MEATTWPRVLVIVLAFAVTAVPGLGEGYDLRLLGIDASSPVQGGGPNPVTAAGFVDGGRSETSARGSSEGWAVLVMTSRVIPGRSDVVAVEATVRVAGIKNGGCRRVWYVLDPAQGYTVTRAGGSRIDESRAIRSDDAATDYRLFFVGKPGGAVVAWVDVYKEWRVRGYKILPDGRGTIVVEGRVPRITGKVPPVAGSHR